MFYNKYYKCFDFDNTCADILCPWQIYVLCKPCFSIYKLHSRLDLPSNSYKMQRCYVHGEWFAYLGTTLLTKTPLELFTKDLGYSELEYPKYVVVEYLI